MDFQAKGLQGQTLAVLGTEFGRTPCINDNDGRDHYEAFICLLSGVGIKGGEADEEHPQRQPRGDPTARCGPGPSDGTITMRGSGAC